MFQLLYIYHRKFYFRQDVVQIYTLSTIKKMNVKYNTYNAIKAMM